MLACIRSFWDHILNNVTIDAILGEIACATEWMAWSLAQRRDIPYLLPYPSPAAKIFFSWMGPRRRGGPCRSSSKWREHAHCPQRQPKRQRSSFGGSGNKKPKRHSSPGLDASTLGSQVSRIGSKGRPSPVPNSDLSRGWPVRSGLVSWNASVATNLPGYSPNYQACCKRSCNFRSQNCERAEGLLPIARSARVHDGCSSAILHKSDRAR